MHFHDAFNLLSLSTISMMSIMNICNQYKYHYLQLYFSTAYFVTDTIFLLTNISLSKSKYAVFMHHIATMFVMYFPYTYKEYRHFLSWTLLIEINTVFIILKRLSDHQIIKPFFYSTWILTRNILIPHLTYQAFHVSNIAAKNHQENIHFHRSSFYLLSSISVFQVYWTFKLLNSYQKT